MVRDIGENKKERRRGRGGGVCWEGTGDVFMVLNCVRRGHWSSSSSDGLVPGPGGVKLGT